MKEDILNVSELPTHTTSSDIFKVLNGFISNGKIALGFVLKALPVLQVEVQV